MTAGIALFVGCMLYAFTIRPDVHWAVPAIGVIIIIGELSTRADSSEGPTRIAADLFSLCYHIVHHRLCLVGVSSNRLLGQVADGQSVGMLRILRLLCSGWHVFLEKHVCG
jgi:hypothetical protein